MVPSDLVIRTAIQTIIQAADPLAVVRRKIILGVIAGENPNLLRSSGDGDRIHGWMIGRGRQENKRQGNPRFADASIQTSYRIDSLVHYRLWFLHYYQHGDDGVADTDSTELFDRRLDDVIEAFALRPRLEIPTGESGAGSHIKQHLEVQVEDDPDIVPCGKEMCHFAPCRLVVDIYRTPAD